jgi:hypothetical protein
MLRIPNYEELRTLLLELPSVVDDVEQRDPASFDRVQSWLRAVERSLANNRMVEAAEFAGLRAQLTMGRLGSLPAGMTVRDGMTSRKVRLVASAEVLRLAGPLLASSISIDRMRLDEADRVARQLVTAARVKGMIPAHAPTGDRWSAVGALWAEMQANAEIGQGAVHIVSLVGPDDAVIVLEHAISRDIWN